MQSDDYLDTGAFAGAVSAGGADLVNAWAAWLRSMHWSYWATLAFGFQASPGIACRAFRQWLALFPHSYAAVGLQRGPAGGLLHVHALVGGVRRVPITATYLRNEWRRGSIAIAGYRPSKGGVEYLVRQANLIEIIGAPILYKPRRPARP